MSSCSEMDDPRSLLDAARRELYCNDRHDLADGYIRRCIALARQRGDRRTTARALLALAFNLRWYRPPDDPRVDPAFEQLPQILENPELLSGESSQGAALLERLLGPVDYPPSSEVSHAMSLFRGLGDEAGIADCLAFMGRIEESLSLSRRINHRPAMIRCLSLVANAKALRGGGTQGHTERDEALRLARELGDKHRLASALSTLAIGCFQGESLRRAYLEAIEIYRQLGHRAEVAETLCMSYRAWDDDPATKLQMMEEALGLWHELGTRFSTQAIVCDQIAEMAAQRGQSARAAEYTRRGAALRQVSDPF
jgi:tetratricopeptide (TPR) repeat protein